MSYLGRRLVRAILFLVGVSALSFVLTELAPGSFFDEMRLNPQISPETIASLQARYGLNQPLLVRYERWVVCAMHADFGYSIAYNVPVTTLLWSRAKNTLLLTTAAVIVTWLVSLPLGVWTAAPPDGWMDRTVGATTSLLISVPEVVIAVALMAIAVRWQVAHVATMRAGESDDLSRWAHARELLGRMLLPVLILVLVESAIIVRHVRASVIDALGKPFVDAARGLGIGRARLLFRHVLPVAANPAISLFGFSLAGLVSGSLLVEVVCGWPGLGPLILDATLSRDFYLVIGGIMFSALFMVGGNLIADVMLLAADPRIRTGAPDAG